MGSEVAVRENHQSLAVAPKYSSEQVKLLADTIARGCDEAELKLFLEIAKLKRLNPFDGQIRPVKRWNSDLGREAMVIQVGIDGYRSTASRTEELAGIDDAVFDSEDHPQPKWAKVTVYRWSHGEKIPYTATARWSEYVQKKKDGSPNSMWSRMPYLMLAKCAEALALRKAFPDELAGMYTEEEMGQADNPDQEARQPQETRQPVQQPQRASDAVVEEIRGEIKTVKPGAADKPGLWLSVGSKNVKVSPEQMRDEMKVGAYLVAMAKRLLTKQMAEVWIVTEVLECSPVQEAEVVAQSETAPEQQDDGGEKTYFTAESVQEPATSGQDLGALFSSGAVKKASDVAPAELPAKDGTIGLKRAQRLRAIVSQNEKKTGFTHQALDRMVIELKLGHLRDLPVAMRSTIEEYADGRRVYEEAE